jgi:hypothetical protein
MRDVHIPSQIAHLKTNGEQWLRFGQIGSYRKQMCVQVDNKKKEEQGLKEGGAIDIKQQRCPLKE